MTHGTCTPPLRLRLGSLLSVAVMFAALAPIMLLTSSPAFAGGGPGLNGGSVAGGNGPKGSPTTNSGVGVGTPSGGTTGGGGGSGGAVTPGLWAWGGTAWQPANPPSPIGGDDFRGKLWSPESNVYHYGNKCEGTAWTDPNGKKYGYLGTEWSLTGFDRPPFIAEGEETRDEDLPSNEYTATGGGYKCIEPPKYTIESWDCLLGGSASYIGPMRNGEVPVKPSKDVALDKQSSQFVLDGKTSPTLCVKAERFNWAVDDLNDWGEYYLNTTAHMQKCEYYEYYTINQQTDKWDANYIDCSGGIKYPVNPDQDLLEVFCNAPQWHKPADFHTHHTYNAADCNPPGGGGGPGPGGSSGKYSWTCGPMPTPTFNGKTNATGVFDVLDDGKDRVLKWDRPGVAGDVQHLTKKMVRLALGDTDSISPYRAGETANSDRQPYVTVPDVDKWKSGWQQSAKTGETGWETAFMAPGVPGKEWTVTPTWAFEAEFLTQVVDTVKINPATNAWAITMKDHWYTSDASCPGAPAALNVYRARNSHGG